MRKLLICPYFGDLPPWWEQYRDEEIPRLERQGYDMLLDFNLDDFRHRVFDSLSVECPIQPNTGKVWDYRPALGLLYEDEITEGGYEWYGHTDFDCVYGRVTADAHLRNCDIYTDCAYHYLSGPWTLYRNTHANRELFKRVRGWEQHLESPTITAWCEKEFSEVAARHARVRYARRGGHGETFQLHRDGDRLMVGEVEVPYFHFKHTKEWPL